MRHVLLLLFVCLALPITAGEPFTWSYPFMQADPKELLTAAQRIAERPADSPDDHPTDNGGLRMLCVENHFKIGADGARTTITRETYQIIGYEGLENFSAIEATWRPWYQGRPQIKARIIHPNGATYQLQESDIVESAARDGENNQFSEDRRLRAPLPKIVVGALVEVQTTTPGVRPFFAAGDQFSHDFFPEAFPQKVVVTTPVETPLSHRADPAMTLAHEHRREDGLAISTWTLVKPAPAFGLAEVLRSGSLYQGTLTLATGTSWQAVGEAYADYVDRALTDQTYPFDLQTWVVPDDHHATALRFMHEIEKAVRYTGLYLGDKDLVPTAPDAVLARGYGDCKDKATLLTGMLRQVGIEAHVALVQSGLYPILEETPGLGAFNHAIVAVTGKDGSLSWLDPTIPLNRGGSLAFTLYGSRALLAKHNNQGLITIPAAVPEEHGNHTDLTITLRALGPTTTHTLSAPYGNREIAFRQEFRDAKHDYDGTPDAKGNRTTTTAMVDASDLSQPFTRNVTFDFKADPGSIERLQCQLPLQWLFEELPLSLQYRHDEDGNGVRVHDAGLYRMTYRITTPTGFDLENPFPTFDFKTKHFSFAMTAAAPDSGTLSLRFESGHYLAEEVGAIRTFLDNLDYSAVAQDYRHRGLKLLQEEAHQEAFAILREEARQSDDAAPHLRLAFALHELGLQEPALAAAQKALAQPLGEQAALMAVAIAAHNFHGQEFGAAFSRAPALRFLEAAMGYLPESHQLRAVQAQINDIDDAGLIITDRDQLERSFASLSEETFGGLEQESLLQNHVLLNRFFAGDYSTLNRLTRTLPSHMRLLYEIAAAAQQDRLAEAVSLAGRTGDPQIRIVLLIQASDLVSRARNYPAALALINAVKHPRARNLLEQRINFLQRTKTFEPATLDDQDPTTPIYRLFANMSVIGGAKPFEPSQFTLPQNEETLEAMQGPFADFVFQVAQSGQQAMGLNQRALWDLMLSSLDLTFLDEPPADGKPAGRIVRVSLKHIGIDQSRVFWVLPGKDGYRIAALIHRGKHLGIGLRHAVTQRRTKDVARLADILFDPQHAETFATLLLRDFAAKWQQLNPQDAPRFALTAALLGPTDQLTRKEIKQLTAFAKTLEPGDLKDDCLLKAVAGLVAAGKADTAVALYEPWYRAHPQFAQATTLLRLYLQADQHEKETALLAELEETDEKGLALSAHRVTRLFASRDYQQIKAAMTRAVENDISRAIGAGNDMAWLSLFLEDDSLETAIEEAERAVVIVDPVQSRVRASGATLHTLATLHATNRSPQKAIEKLRHAMKVEHRFEPEGVDWYVLGLIAQQLGFAEEARTYYGRVPEDDEPLATYQLVLKRLAELDQATAQPQTASAPVDSSAGKP